MATEKRRMLTSCFASHIIHARFIQCFGSPSICASHLVLPQTYSHLLHILFCHTYHSRLTSCSASHITTLGSHLVLPRTTSHLPHILFCLPQTALDALFVGFCEDVCRNNGTDQPYFMSDNIMVRIFRFLWFH